MFEVRISDELYQRAARAAQAQQLSLEQFVNEVLQIHLQDEDAAIQKMFTAERLAHLAEADAEIDAGQFFTVNQVDEHFAQKHGAWLHQHQL